MGLRQEPPKATHYPRGDPCSAAVAYVPIVRPGVAISQYGNADRTAIYPGDDGSFARLMSAQPPYPLG
jgi:hypothetical protein